MNDASPAADPSQLSASALARAIAAKTLSPVDVVDALLARIERLEPRLQAYVEVYGASARLANTTANMGGATTSA